jgi:hypothetical protein
MFAAATQTAITLPISNQVKNGFDVASFHINCEGQRI